MPTLSCPHCRHFALEPVHLQDIEVDVCTHCGGMWFDAAELDQVIRQYDPDYPKTKLTTEEMGSRTQKARWLCPACRAPLDSYEFEPGSELQIDICEQCQGIWLEHGELDHAKAYYEIPEALERIKKKRSAKDWFFQFLLQLPVEFNFKPRRTPVVTLSLIALNVFIFIIGLAEPVADHLNANLAMWPAHFGSLQWIVSLITYQFLHGGFIHLAGNMYFLYILGDNLEDALGRFRYLLFYLVCGVVGGVAQTLISMGSQILVVGASGAIAGVMAGYLYTFRKAHLTFLFIFFQWKLPAVGYFGIWVAINIFGLLVSNQNVAWFAHLGGFAAGLGLIAMLYPTIIRSHPLVSYLNHTAKFEPDPLPAQPASKAESTNRKADSTNPLPYT